jgi:TonB family protein
MSRMGRNATFVFNRNYDKTETSLLSKFYALSVIIHIALVIAFGSGLFFGGKKKLEFDSVQARLVKLGKERDEKLLPRITKPKKSKAHQKDKKGNSLKPVKKKEKKKKKVEKKVKKPPSLAELLSDSMKDIKEDARAEETDEGAKDGVADGDVTDPALALKANMYTRKVSALIRKNWQIPAIIKKEALSALSAEVFFRITYSGEVYGVEVVTASGNNIFDSSVIEAIKKTGTLPLPKDRELKKLVLQEGFECPFTPG